VASLSDGVTVTLCVPPPAGAVQLVGVTVNVAVPAACVTVTLCPAMVAVAVRVAALVVAAAVRVTLPLPVPLAALRVSHDWLLVAVHVASLRDGVTDTTCVPPPAGALQLVGVTVKVAVPADCVTLKVCPAMVAVADRLAALVVAAAVSVTVPFPPPDVGEAVNHAALVWADHGQPAPAVTPTLTDPPAAAMVADVGEIVGAQLGSEAKPYPHVVLGTVPRACAWSFRYWTTC
jgi:hypothetical protein